MPSLTSHLLNLDEAGVKEATNHPFLAAAATGSLPLDRLIAWLAQDRLYQLAYLNFIGNMLSSLPVPAHIDRDTSLEWRAADVLIDALTNLRQEIKLFEDTATQEGFLDAICDVTPAVETRAYQDLFAGATAQGRPLIVGLVALWATEECYLRSWRWAWSRMDQGVQSKDRDVMQRVFIPNWSSPEFEAFVRRIGGLVNKFGGYYEEGGFEWRECEAVFKQILWAEKHFWPKID